jgi:hypothetical protein
MGTWGYKTFEDDMTLDWIARFESNPSINTIENTFSIALNSEFVDDLSATSVLAAAEVLAAINGSQVSALSENQLLLNWVSSQSLPNPDLLKTAREAVSKVFQESELREIWEDAGEESVRCWKVEIDSLVERLSLRNA